MDSLVICTVIYETMLSTKWLPCLLYCKVPACCTALMTTRLNTMTILLNTITLKCLFIDRKALQFMKGIVLFFLNDQPQRLIAIPAESPHCLTPQESKCKGHLLKAVTSCCSSRNSENRGTCSCRVEVKEISNVLVQAVISEQCFFFLQSGVSCKVRVRKKCSRDHLV